MENLNIQQEIKKPAEAEENQEQSPEDFQSSLDIFNTYKQVTEEEAKQPEYAMRFDDHEQGLVVGLRGTLNEFITEAAENKKSVTIGSMFDRVDAAIRSQGDKTDPETLDQLYLVATKMRYNLQVRFDKKQRNEDTTPETPFAKNDFAASDKLLATFSSLKSR